MSDEKPKAQQSTATPRTYLISSEQLMDIMRYLMTRPYGEVITLMNSLATLTPFKSQAEEKDNGKK